MKKKPFAIFCLACLALAAIQAGILRAAKYPPGLHWHEIERGPFTVIYPAQRWPQAEAALARAESAYEKLAAFWNRRPTGRTRIVIDDSVDDSNGFATFFPFNLVGTNLSEPSPDSDLAGSGSWLDLVLVHELAHIFTMDSASEPFRKLRRIFGSQPVLYPAVQLPPWAIEGLAVWCESEFTGDGRLNHPPYPLMLAAARQDDLFPGWSSISGTPAAWPGPAGKYLFGAGFMEFLAKKYGSDGLRQYLERASSRVLTFGSRRDFKKVFGESLDELWGSYRDRVPAASKPVRQPLTHNGFLKQYPCPLGEDRLVYYRRNYRSRGEVVALNLKTGLDEPLFKMDGVNGLSVAEFGKKILLSAVDNFHAFSEFSDLYEYDLEKRKLKRLSRGQRLSQPVATIDPHFRSMKDVQALKDTLDKNGDAVAAMGSEEIYCVQRRDGQYHLSLFESATGRLWIKSRPFAGMAQPAVNPNGQMIAAAVKPEGGPWGIVLFWKDGEIFKFFSVPGSNLSQPRWLGEDTLLFILSEKEDSRLVGYSFTECPSGPSPDGPFFSTDDSRLAGVRQFAVSDKEWDIFFTYYSGRGQEIGRLNFENARWSPREITVASGIPEVQPSPATARAAQIRAYRFWRDLLPRWWTPAWRLAGDEFQAGIITGGQDSLGIHSYSLEGYWGFRSKRANIAARYIYDGLFPTLALAYSDSTDVFLAEDFSRRSQVLKLASLWPLRLRKRSQLHAYADLHLERRSNIFSSGTTESSRSLNGLCLGLEFNSTREYYDSVSPADGIRVMVQGSVQPAGMGNARANRTIQAVLRHYIPLFRPGVLAWRLAGARGWDSDPRLYTLGGRQSGSGLGDGQPFHLLRGFPAGSQWGDRGWLFNLEYRLPLFKIEKAVLPAVSLDRVYFNTFFDAGRLGHGEDAFPTAYSAGAEAVLRLAFGGAAVYDLSCGTAYGFGPVKQWQVYARMGRSF